MECEDFSEFQEMLKSMRKIDDMIVSTINTLLPTDSFHPDGAAACKGLHTQLEEGYSKRENVIKKCITTTADHVKTLKEKRLSDSDHQISKSLRAEQTKLRMLQVELSVEELVKQRTLKVFNEKCRKYFKS